MAKIFSWTRAIVLILSMLFAQFPLLNASAAPAPVEGVAPLDEPAPDVGGGDSPLVAASAPGDVAAGLARQGGNTIQDCKIKVMAVAVTDFDPEEPDPSQPPDSSADPNPAFGATAIKTLTEQVDQVLIWVVIMNWTGKGDSDCPVAETITITSAAVTVNSQSPLPFQGQAYNALPALPHELAGAGDYIAGKYYFPIGAETPSTLHIHLDVYGEDSDPSDPYQGEVYDVDNWDVTLATPGFEVDPFTPSVDTANPGDYVNFTLRVRNTRSGVNITDLSFASDLSGGQCNDLGDWTLVPSGAPVVSTFIPGQIAECVIHNVQMPADSPSGEFRLVGDLTARAGEAVATLEDVTSEPVTLYQASIKVTKKVDRIMRGTQQVQPPVQPGDRIYYTITIENTSQGGISLEQITVQDSLTGRLYVDPARVLAPGGAPVTVNTVWTVLPNSQDPLTNIVSVTARVVGTGKTVSADTAVSVDVADSALRVELAAEPPTANVGTPVTFRMTLYNDGDQPIQALSYATLPGGLKTYGTPPALPSQIPAHSSTPLPWTYTILAEDPDPLVNTVRVTGTVDGRTLAAQAQAVVDVTNPNIEITVTVVEPPTTTVLRGGEAIYAVEVQNKSATSICGVTVSQSRIDPESGQETLIIPALPLSWPGVTPGQLDGLNSGLNTASGSTTYRITSSEKNPLHMVFAVTAQSECPGGGQALSDRTSRVLEISDVQVNAEIQASVASTPVTSAEVGDVVNFTYLVTNVGTITLSTVSAVYCFPSRDDCSDPVNFHPLAISPLDNGALLNYATASGLFTTTPMTQDDADAGQFPVEVTLSATDNRGRDVRLKTTGVIDVTSQDFTLEVAGPAQAVSGDTRNFAFVLTNNTGDELTNVRVVVQDAIGTVLKEWETLGADSGQPIPFSYRIDAPPDAALFRLTLRAEATKAGGGTVVATGSHKVELIPLVTVEKTGPPSVTPGDNIDYYVKITNNSVGQTFTVSTLADDVLADYGVTFDVNNFGPWASEPGDLGPGESVSALLTLRNVQGNVPRLVNTFTVTGTKDGGQPVPPASDQHEVEVTCPVDFVANVTGLPILGQTLHWEITLFNTTGVDLTGLQVEESLNWGGVVPGLPTTLPAYGTLALPAFDKPVTNDYYSAIIKDAFMTSTLRATFGKVAGVGECVEEIKEPLYSPIAVSKTSDTSIALTGDTIHYTIELRNLSPDDTYWVTLSDPMLSPDPIPMYYNGTGQPATESGAMSPGETVTGDVLSYIVKANDPEKLTNTATAKFPDPDDPQTTFYTEGKAEVLTIAPLTLVKTPSSATGIRGTEISYTYELTNNTEYDITGVTLSDDRIGTLVPGPYLEPLGRAIDLLPYETRSFTVTYSIPIDAPHPLINTATATGTVHLPAGPRQVTYEATIAVQLKEPAITIEKTIVDAATLEELPDDLPQTSPDGDGILEGTVGQQVRYCFTVTNDDPSPDSYVADIVIEDEKLGAGVLQPLFLAAIADKYGPRAEGDWLFGGESVNFCYPQGAPLALNRAQGDPQTNTVTLRGVTPSGAGTIPVYTDDSVTVDLLGTDILITKSTSQPLAYIGQDVTYTLRIENRNQSSAINGLEVFDSFLGEIDLDAPGWDWSAAGGAPGTLGVGGYATYSYVYTIQPQDPDPLVNSALVTGTLADGEGSPVEDATQSALAITPSQLLVRKYPSITRALPAQVVHYTIAITNVGQVPVFGLTASDTQMAALPAPSLTELWPNKTAYITYDLAMPTADELAADPGLDPFVNTITVSGTIYDENSNPLPDPVTGQATAMVDIIQPKISISKVPQVEAATPGGEVPYTITIRNTGGQGDTLSDLIFRDLTMGDEIDLDSVCPGNECPFVYGPEPYADDGSGTFQPNPLNGTPYDPDANGPLQPGEMLIGTITVTVPPEEAGTEFTNTAEIEASSGASTVRDRSAATIDVRQEGVSVTKTSDTSVAVIGQQITYTIAVQNTGRVPFTRLRIVDPALPDGQVTITGGFPVSDQGGADTLDPGEVHPYSYTYTIQEQDADPHTNRATVSATTAIGATIASSAQATVDIQIAEVDVEKFVCVEDNSGNSVPDPCTSVVNVADEQLDEVFYYIRISNPGIVAIENITVNDPLAPDGTFDATNWPGNALEPGAEAWFKYGYTVQDADLDVFWNTVTVNASTPTTPPQTAEDAARAALRLVTSDLQLTKTGPAQAQVGDTVTYTLTVTHLNPTGEPITDIKIRDPLSGSTDPLCEVSNLAPGATSAPCSFSYMVSLADPSPLVNQAFAEGTQGAVTVRDTATHTLEIVTPGLSVRKTASAPVAAFGDEVTFTYVVENTGTSQLSAVMVTDSDPAIMFNAPWPPTLAAGQVAVRTATRTMTMRDPDPYTNTVTVTGTRGGLPVRAEASATVALSANGTLAVSNVPDRQYVADGGTVIFAYTARNLGTEPLNNVTFSDNLCGAGLAQPSSQTLAPRGSVTVYCTVNGVTLPGPLVSTARVTADADGLPVSDTATAQVEVIAGGLLVSKSADRFVAQPGDTVTYTITVQNVGDEALRDLALYESMGLTLTPPLPDSLRPGASVTLTGAYTIPTADPPDSVSNTVTVAAVGATTGDNYSDSASVAVAVVENPDAILALTKQATASTQPGALRARPGDAVSYTFTIRNFSDQDALDVRLTDSTIGTDDPVGDLAPGETATFTAEMPIPPDYAQTTFNNTASVFANGSQEPEDTASASIPVQLVGLTKTAVLEDPDVAPGDDVLYTFTITSFTTSPLSDIMLEDEGLTLDTTFPITLTGLDQRTVTGTMTVPPEHPDPEFVNTAALTRNGEWLDEASATVPVVTRELEITIDSISQVDPGTQQRVTELLQTGEPVQIAFTVRNNGTVPIQGVTVTGVVEFSGRTDSVVCGALVSELPVGDTGTASGVCTYTPPAGKANYPQPEDLTPTVKLTATNIDGTLTDRDSGEMALVDLKLGAELTVAPESVPVGGQIEFALTITNLGASSIGCNVGDDRAYCALRVLVGSENPVLNDLLEPFRAALAGTVLGPGETFSQTLSPYTVQTDNFPTWHSLTVYGGYYADSLDAAGLLGAYVVSAQASTAFLVELPGIEVRITRADPFGISQVIYGIEIENTGNVALFNLAAEFEVEGEAPVAFQLPTNTLEPGEVITANSLAAETRTEPYLLSVVATGNTPSGAAVEDSDEALVTPGVPLDALWISIERIVQERGGVDYIGSPQLPFQTGFPVAIDIRVTNDTDQTITNIIPNFYVDPDNNRSCFVVGSPVIAVLAPGASAERRCYYTPTVAHPAYPGFAPILSRIMFGVTGEQDGVPIVGAGDERQVKMIDLALQVLMDAEPTTVLPGRLVEFTIFVNNQGASPLGCGSEVAPDSQCHIRLTSPNPDLNVAISEFSASLRNLVLPPRSGQWVTFVMPVSQPIQPNLSFANYALTATGGYHDRQIQDVVRETFIAWDTTDIVLAYELPRLEVRIQAMPLPPIFGQNITYTVMVQNSGLIPVTLEGGTYQIIPMTTAQAVDGIMLTGYGPRPQAQSGALTFTPTTLQPGQVAYATVSKIEDQIGTYRFLATVNGLGIAQPISVSAELVLTPFGVGTPTPTVDPATLDPNATEPQVSKEPSAATAQPGGPLSWTIKVRNGSTAVMPGVVVTDTVPPTMTLTAAASDRGQATVSGSQVSLPVGTLNPGETVTLTITTTLSTALTAPATVTNTACAARQGGPQVCDVGTVTLGPGVSTLPATGIRSSNGGLGWRWDALLGVGFSGALMLFLSVHASQRRRVVAIIFVLVALLAIGGAVALVLTQGDDDETPEDQAQAPGAPSPGDTPQDEPSADIPPQAGAPAEIAFPTPYEPPKPSGARTLLIPKLSESFPAPIPILEVPIINRQWDVSGLGYYIGWLDGTTWLEPDWGNTVLAAHVQLDAQTPGPFSGLNELVPGDEIIIREGDMERVYVVMSTRKVAPNDVSVTAPTEDPMLTLVTCTDWNNAYGVFAQRLVVQAIPVT